MNLTSWSPSALDEAVRSTGMVGQFRDIAKDVEKDVRPRLPSRFAVSTRAGEGRRGVFAQVVSSGSGSILEEFGGRGRAAGGQLRSAIAKRRG